MKNSGRTSKNCVLFEVLMKEAYLGNVKQSCGVAGHQVELRTGGEGQVSAAQAPQVPQLTLIIISKSDPFL